MAPINRSEFVRHAVNKVIINEAQICIERLRYMDVLLYSAEKESIDLAYFYLKSKELKTTKDIIVVQNTIKRHAYKARGKS